MQKSGESSPLCLLFSAEKCLYARPQAFLLRLWWHRRVDRLCVLHRLRLGCLLDRRLGRFQALRLRLNGLFGHCLGCWLFLRRFLLWNRLLDRFRLRLRLRGWCNCYGRLWSRYRFSGFYRLGWLNRLRGLFGDSWCCLVCHSDKLFLCTAFCAAVDGSFIDAVRVHHSRLDVVLKLNIKVFEHALLYLCVKQRNADFDTPCGISGHIVRT